MKSRLIAIGLLVAGSCMGPSVSSQATTPPTEPVVTKIAGDTGAKEQFVQKLDTQAAARMQVAPSATVPMGHQKLIAAYLGRNLAPQTMQQFDKATFVPADTYTFWRHKIITPTDYGVALINAPVCYDPATPLLGRIARGDDEALGLIQKKKGKIATVASHTKAPTDQGHLLT